MTKTRISSQTIPATCVVLPGGLGAVLFLGRSGAGKSDMALRLIMQHGGALIADDQVTVALKNKSLLASAPKSLKGLLEVRGAGILKMPVKASAPVKLVVQLVASARDVERLPKLEYNSILGVSVPLIRLFAPEASAACKVVASLQSLQAKNMLVGAFKE